MNRQLNLAGLRWWKDVAVKRHLAAETGPSRLQSGLGRNHDGHFAVAGHFVFGQAHCGHDLAGRSHEIAQVRTQSGRPAAASQYDQGTR
jgi:hypothetical protein